VLAVEEAKQGKKRELNAETQRAQRKKEAQGRREKTTECRGREHRARYRIRE
jgi:hypothetical protein